MYYREIKKEGEKKTNEGTEKDMPYLKRKIEEKE